MRGQQEAATGRSADRRVPVGIVDDHPVMAQALAMALQMHGVEVACVMAGEEATEAAVLSAIEAAAPITVLLDVRLGGRLSIALIGPLRERGAEVLILTGERDQELLTRCVEAGAAGVFAKAQAFDQLVERLVDSATGQTRLEDAARRRLVGSSTNREMSGRDEFERLTTREADVLRGLVRGQSPDEIAVRHGIALNTVRSHLKSIFAKLGVNSQLAAVALARTAGWPGDDPSR